MNMLLTYLVGSKSFRPDIQKPRQMENAMRDILYSAIYGEVNVSVEKCVEIKGDYVEEQRSCLISVTLKSWSGRKLLDPTTYVSSTQHNCDATSTRCG